VTVTVLCAASLTWICKARYVLLGDSDVPHCIILLNLKRSLQLGNFHPRWFFFELSQHALMQYPLWQKDALTLMHDCDLSYWAVRPIHVISQVLSG